MMHSSEDGQMNIPDQECLFITAFPGPLSRPSEEQTSNSEGGTAAIEVHNQILHSNPRHNWTALDYDEGMGRIALATTFGTITVLEL
jgi:hypothetical protein